jgi:hypothetical protein
VEKNFEVGLVFQKQKGSGHLHKLAMDKTYEWTPVQPKVIFFLFFLVWFVVISLLFVSQVVPRIGEKTAEEKAWNRFRFPLLVKEVGSVTHLSFHPVNNYVAVTAGPRIHAYEGRFPSADPIKSFSKFKGLF